MKPIRNNPNAFFSPCAGALGTPPVPHAPVCFGSEAVVLLSYSTSAMWGFCVINCGNPTNLVGLPQWGAGDKMVLPSTGGIGGVDGKPELQPTIKKEKMK